jgi:hypothetical protein
LLALTAEKSETGKQRERVYRRSDSRAIPDIDVSSLTASCVVTTSTHWVPGVNFQQSMRPADWHIRVGVMICTARQTASRARLRQYGA